MLDKAAGDVEKLTKAQDKQVASTKKVEKAHKDLGGSIDDLSGRYHSFLGEVEKGNSSYEDTVFNLKRFRAELDAMANRSWKRGWGGQASQLNEFARQAERIMEDIENARKSNEQSTMTSIRERVAAHKKVDEELMAAEKRRIAQAVADEKKLTAETQREVASREAFEKAADRRAVDDQRARQTALENEVNDRIDAAHRMTVAREKGEAEAEKLRVQQEQRNKKQAEKETLDFINGLIAREREGKANEARLADFQIKEAARVEGARHALRQERAKIPEPQPRNERSLLARMFNIDDDKIGRITDRMKEFESSANAGGFSAVKLAGNLRGLVIVGIIGFFQQLVSVGGALGATLIAIAASAIQAGAALAGMAVSGVAQALPVIGLFAAAWGRVGAVFQAVKQSTLATTRAADDHKAALDRQRTAADQVRNAQQALSDANRNVADAEVRVTEARKQATRQLEDMVAAQRQAQIQAESAVLAQTDAQRALRKAVAGGDFGNLAARALDVRSARLQVGTSRTASTRANQDLAATHGDIQNLDVLKNANRALEDAVRNAGRASQALADAKRNAASAAQDTGSAQKKLAELLAQLSPAERRLYTALLRLRGVYKQVFTGPGGVLESIINAFTYGVKRGEELLRNGGLISAAKKLADGMGTQLQRIIDFLSSPDSVSFIERMAGEARRNLPIVVGILGNIWTLFKNIADAGSGAFHRFLIFIARFTGNAAAATSTGGGLGKLEAFFKRGEKYAESWLTLFGAVFRLIGALLGTSAQEGTNAVDDLTKQIDKATAYINNNQKAVRDFFRQARKASYDVVKAIAAIARELGKLYHPDQVGTLADALDNSLLPALGNILQVMGAIAEIFLKIAASKAGGVLIELTITALALNRVFVPIVSVIGKVAGFFFELIGSARGARLALVAVKFISGPFGLAIAFISALLLIFHNRLHGVGDYLKVFGGILAGVTVFLVGRNGLVGAIGMLTKGLEALAGASMLGKLGRLGKVLGAIFAGGAGLLRKIPGVTKLLGEGAKGTKAATRSADFLDVAVATEKEGTKVGGILGKFAAPALTGILKKAGWLGVGISAGEGIISGFKHGSVGAGVQDFLHSITFGIVKSVDQAAAEAYKRQLKRINADRPIQRSPGTHTPGLPDIRPPTPQATPRSASGSPLPYYDRANKGGLTQDEKDWAALSDKQKKVLTGVETLRQKLREFRRTVYTQSGYDYLKSQLDDFIKKHPEATAAIDALEARLKRFKRSMDREFALSNIITNFGIALQAKKPDIDKITTDMIGSIKKLPKSMRHQAEQGAIQMAQGLANKGKITQAQADKIRHDVVTAMQKMREQSARRAAGTASDTAAALNALATAISIQFSVVVGDVNKVLNALGAKEVKFPHLTKKNINKYAAQAGAIAADPVAGVIGLLAPSSGGAVGGWVGNKGERGQDSARYQVQGKAVGRGEAILNWAHQKAVEPAMAFTKAVTGKGYGSLDELFSKVRGEHKGGGILGFARGGYVQNAQAPTGPNSGPIRSLLRQLFGMGYNATSAGEHRGTGTLHDQQAAADFGNSANNLTRLARVLWPMRRRFDELFMPTSVPHGGLYHFGSAFQNAGLQREHQDHIHVGILGRLAGALRKLRNLGSSVADVFQEIVAPSVRGKGAAAELARGALDKITAAANRRMAHAASRGGPSPQVDLHASGSGMALMKRIAKQNNWSFADWWAIDATETSHGRNLSNPGSSARLRGQFMDINYGKYGKGSDPAQHPSMREQIFAMARYIADRYGNPTKAWAYHKAHNSYEHGGPVGGQGAQPIVAHGGEHVWTASEVARAGGHGVMTALRSFFGGGKQAVGRRFAAGGKVPGAYTEPTIHGIDVAGITAQIERAQSLIARMPTRLLNSKATDRLSKSIGELTRQDGLLDQMDTALTTHVETMGRRLKLATYQVTQAGLVLLRLKPDEVAAKEFGNLVAAYGDLVGQRGLIQKSLDDVAQRLKGAKGGERSRLIGLQRTLHTRLGKVNQSIADNLESRYSSVESQYQNMADAVAEQTGRKLGGLDLAQRARDVAGPLANRVGLPSQAAIGQARGGALGMQANQTEWVATAARKAGHGDLADKLMATVKDLRMQALEAVASGIAADADEVNKTAGRKTAALDIRGRVATALGKVGDLSQIATERVTVVTDQIAELTKRKDAATAAGAGAVASDIEAQIADLQTSITEMAAQQLADATDQVNNAAARANSRLDLKGRLADLKESAGNWQGAFRDRGDILQKRRDVLETQQSGLQGLLQQAIASGNEGAAQSLGDQLAELGVQLEENSAAIKSNTVQARQAAIDHIMSRQSFLGGTNTGLQGLLTALGSLSGQVDLPRMGNLIRQGGVQLRDTGHELRHQLESGYGIDTQGLSGTQLVDKLSNMDFSSIEAGMTEEQKTQFENLIQAIIDNATAVEQNTDQLKQLTGAENIQNFSSTGWQWFRNAIFNGAGGLLPQYATPSNAMSGWNWTAAPSSAATAVATANGSSGSDDHGGAFHAQINVTEQVQDAHPDVVANRLMYRYKNRK